jgi:hypothetical protein
MTIDNGLAIPYLLFDDYRYQLLPAVTHVVGKYQDALTANINDCPADLLADEVKSGFIASYMMVSYPGMTVIRRPLDPLLTNLPK